MEAFPMDLTREFPLSDDEEEEQEVGGEFAEVAIDDPKPSTSKEPDHP